MKLFPGLFYIACIVLLGIRLRPLHQHHSSLSASISSVGRWQREFNLCIGWLHRLFTALISWLYRHSAPLYCLPPPSTATPDSGYTFFTWFSLWRSAANVERLKSVVSGCGLLREVSGCVYAPVAATFEFIRMYCMGSAQAGDQMSDSMMGRILALCRTASDPLLELPGFGTPIPLITELEELGVVEELKNRIVGQV